MATKLKPSSATSASQGDWRPMPKPGIVRSSAQKARKPQYWWQTIPKYQLWALGVAAVTVVWCALTYPAPTLGAIVATVVVVGRVQMVRHDRRVRVQHVWDMVQPHLGLPSGYYPDASEWVTLPRDLTAKDAVVRLELPKFFSATPDRKQAIADAVSGALPGTWEARWHVKFTEKPIKSWWRKFTVRVLGHHTYETPHVTFRHPPEPPAHVRFADPEVQERFRAGPEHLVPIGLDHRQRWVEININGDSPHIAYSGGTGAGKSTTLRGIISYLLYHGTEFVDIVDPKRISLTKAFGKHPRVRIHKHLADQEGAVEKFHAEMQRRYAWAEEQEDEETALESLPRKLLVIEEGGSFFDMVKTEWKNVKTKDDPAESPTMTMFRHILFQGRQAKMTVLLVVQQGNARDMGGSAARDQFAAKILVRFSRQVWGMLVGTTPVPQAPTNSGRGIVVMGDQEIRSQLVNTSSDEAREFSMENAIENHDGEEIQGVVPSDEGVRDSRDHLRVVPDTVQDTPEETSPAKTPENDHGEASTSPRWVSKPEVLARFEMTESAFDKWRQRTKKELSEKGESLPEGKRIKGRLHWTEDEVDQMEILRKGDAA